MVLCAAPNRPSAHAVGMECTRTLGVFAAALPTAAEEPQLQRRIQELEALAHREAGREFNLGSPQEVGWVVCVVLWKIVRLPNVCTRLREAGGSPAWARRSRRGGVGGSLGSGACECSNSKIQPVTAQAA